MSSTIDKARATQIANIEKKTGKSLAELRKEIEKSGLTKHGEIRTMLMETFSLGHGDANSLVHYALASDGQSAAEAKGASTDDVVSDIYSGAKTALRPIHDAVMKEIEKLGPFEIAPKKGYLSLRRKKQFAMVGPATSSRVEVGLNMKGVTATDRLMALPPDQMCQYKVKLTSAAEVDAELAAWIRTAYETSG